MSTLSERFEAFARAYPGLRLYRRFSEGAARDPEICDLLAVARAGQARPVLLFAAVHDLILADPDLPLARWYSSVTPREDLATGDPWPTFRATCLDHRDELAAVISTRSTQTNEVNRAVLVAVLVAAACADTGPMPVSLVELGSSAGLLLGTDRYAVEVGADVVGDPHSAVRCAGAVRGDVTPDLSSFPDRIVDRVGIDRDPVDLGDPDRVRWLEACLWPDEPWRIERFRGAVAAMRADPPRVVTGDLVADLDAVVATIDPRSHLVMFDTWAVTYVAHDRRGDLADAAGRAAARGRPVSWVSAEPPGAVPGVDPPGASDDIEEAAVDTVLGMRRWRDGAEVEPVALGWAHPHGNWVCLVG